MVQIQSLNEHLLQHKEQTNSIELIKGGAAVPHTTFLEIITTLEVNLSLSPHRDPRPTEIHNRVNGDTDIADPEDPEIPQPCVILTQSPKSKKLLVNVELYFLQVHTAQDSMILQVEQHLQRNPNVRTPGKQRN